MSDRINDKYLEKNNKIIKKYYEIKEIVVEIIKLMKKYHRNRDFQSFNLIKSFCEIENYIKCTIDEKDFSSETRKILKEHYDEFFENSHGGLSEFYFYQEDNIEKSRSDTHLLEKYLKK